MHAQLGPFPQPSSRLWVKKICMSGLDADHIQFDTTPNDKYQYQ